MKSRFCQRFVGVMAGCLLAGSLVSCAGQAASSSGDGGQVEAAASQLADGTYTIEADTDSSMFRVESCELVVKDGTYTATIVLPGEGFSRLYFGTAEEAAQADDADIYDNYLNNDEKYTFDVPVSALDEELAIAAFGQRRDTWYDHTIVFHAPAEAE